ncbi:capsular biosynthesis protein [Burkholderia ubonensis]|uniref:Putative tyrosine-protein kinase EpsB n=1 Tax=Burkholderia ubonensis TaxID=101571 RepID=A0AB73FVG9_9BURK|nr:polysaccharide biosynthesis tyrosine autokinase [Burkholderia ubonensis]KVK83880.1 capsular biosynthesis protein [Burkholderia ubonensis]KVL82919.1 capsular biosynthesis protein [Burkholderia ubonensis]KVM23916.1 capsular biosynthesis protein [Burkholderia ubonensis]KVM35419.1 capsular biosynthesis protein [Burkholderia ubonensis]
MTNLTLPGTHDAIAMRPPKSTRRYLSTLYGARRLIVGSVLACTLAGALYALCAQPVYRSDILFQVEQNQTDTKALSNDPSAVFDLKTDASTEIELLKSRAVMSRAVDSVKLYINATPRYLPMIGWRFADAADSLSTPLPGGYVSGTERIDVATFNVPKRLYEKRFVVTAGGDGTYTLQRTGLLGTKGPAWLGRVGQPLHIDTPQGPIDVLVRELAGAPGARFDLTRYGEDETIDWLQKVLLIAERGKQSNMIGVTLDGTDPVRGSRILEAIGNAYVAQNAQRKADAADKLIRFLDAQLPIVRSQLEAAEDRFNEFRASHRTVNTSDEGLALRQQSVDIESRVQTLQQRRAELLTRFMPKHPAVVDVDAQLADARRSLDGVRAQIQRLPAVEQGVLQLQRDVAVDTALYTNLLNTRQQMTLVRASRAGNVRIVDPARVADKPVQPHRGTVVVGAMVAGVLAGIAIAIMRQRLVGAVEDPEEIEWSTGLPVFATVPHSVSSTQLTTRARWRPATRVSQAVANPAIESLRSLRTTLQLSLQGALNRVVLITGPTTRVGKSFVASNLAMLAGASNRRVLLIDADLRRGSLHDRFRYSRGPGLADVISGTHRLDEVLKRTVVPGVDFVSTGSVTPNPSELLLQPELAALIDRVSSQYDMIVIDGPPLLPVADALVLGRLAGTVLMVVRSGVTTVTEIDESMRRLAQASVTTGGVILNDFRRRPGQYDYSHADPDSRPSASDYAGVMAARRQAG